MKCSFTWRSALHLTQQKALITSAAARVFPRPRESWRPGAKRAGERDLQGVWVQMQIKTSRRCACLQASYFPHRRRKNRVPALIMRASSQVTLYRSYLLSLYRTSFISKTFFFLTIIGPKQMFPCDLVLLTKLLT